METAGTSTNIDFNVAELVRALLLLIAEVLLYSYAVMPKGVEKALALVSLHIPAQADEFGTVWPYYSLVHAVALVIAMTLYAGGYVRSILRNKAFLVFAVINLVAIIWMVANKTPTQQLYWDYCIEFLRLGSLVALGLVVLEARHYTPDVLVRILLIVLSIPMLMLIATDMGHFLAEREGRVNAPGLELTSTGHVGAMAVLLALSLPLRHPWRIALGLVGAGALLESGARIPLVVCFGVSLLVLWRHTKGAGKRIAMVGAVLILAYVAIWLGSLRSVGGGRLSTFGDSGGLEEEYLTGRAIALVASLNVMSDHPLGYMDSDWAIQEELVSYGFPSHTHSHYFQSYLRYGPLMLLFWGLLWWQAVAGWRAGSPYAPTLLFILVGSAFDYYGFVTKAMLIVFLIVALNAHFLRGPKLLPVCDPSDSHLPQVLPNLA